MAKVLGVIFTILGGFASLVNIFLYQNSSAFLSYNPSAPMFGLRDSGLALQIVLFGLIFLAGILLLKYSSEPDVK